MDLNSSFLFTALAKQVQLIKCLNSKPTELGNMISPEDVGFTPAFKKQVTVFWFQRMLERTLGFASNCLPPMFPLPLSHTHTGTHWHSQHDSYDCTLDQAVTCCLVWSLRAFTLLFYGKIIDLVFVEATVPFSLSKSSLSVCLLFFLRGLGGPIPWPNSNPCFLFQMKQRVTKK